MANGPPPIDEPMVSVAMGRWAVAGAPAQIRTLLGSCAGVVLYDRASKVGGVAHILLPQSRGNEEHPGKFADTAIPAMLAEVERSIGRPARARLVAKLFGGASMFPSLPGRNIGQLNREAADRILDGLGIPVVARDVGGDVGRRLTLDTRSGVVAVRLPSGAAYDL